VEIVWTKAWIIKCGDRVEKVRSMKMDGDGVEQAVMESVVSARIGY
jgi:hypothetical protein